MSKEFLQPEPDKKSGKKRFVPKILNTAIIAGGLSLALASSNDSVQSPSIFKDFAPTPDTQIYQEPPITTITSSPQLQEEQSKNEWVSNILDDNYTRAGLGALLGISLGMAMSSHLLGRKYDENIVHALRVSGPLVMAASASSTLVDSFKTIDANIPLGLFLASTFLMGSYQIINTFQHHKDPKLRAAAFLTAGSFSAIGATALVAFNYKDSII